MLIILLPAILKSWAAIFYDDKVVGYIYITLGLSVVIFLKLLLVYIDVMKCLEYKYFREFILLTIPNTI